MKKYPLIERLGLEVTKINYLEFVTADDIEKLLSEGVKVYGGLTTSHAYKQGNNQFNTDMRRERDTVQGLVINIKPIEKPKPVSKADIKKALSQEQCGVHLSTNKVLENWREILERIESQGIE